MLPREELALERRKQGDSLEGTYFTLSAMIKNPENQTEDDLCTFQSQSYPYYRFWPMTVVYWLHDNSHFDIGFCAENSYEGMEYFRGLKKMLPRIPIRIVNRATGQSCIPPMSTGSLIQSDDEKPSLGCARVNISRIRSNFECAGIKTDLSKPNQGIEIDIVPEGYSGKLMHMNGGPHISTFTRPWIPYDADSPDRVRIVINGSSLQVKFKLLDDYKPPKGIEHLILAVTQLKDDHMPLECYKTCPFEDSECETHVPDGCPPGSICCHQRIDRVLESELMSFYTLSDMEWAEIDGVNQVNLTVPWLSESGDGKPCTIALDLFDRFGPTDPSMVAISANDKPVTRFQIHTMSATCV